MSYFKHLRTLTLSAFALSCIGFSAHAQMMDFVDGFEAQVSVKRNGIPVQVRDGDAQEIALRVTDIFNNNNASTQETWYRQGMEMRDINAADQWALIKNGSYVSVKPKAKEDKPVSDSDIIEIIQSINENASDGYFGITLAQMRGGDIHIFRGQGREMIALYCLDIAQKYLPDHYNSLHEKYNTKEYDDAGLSCKAPEM